MHTQEDGPLSISLPPPCVSEGLAGLENRCQVSFHLLCYQHSNVLLQENICLSMDGPSAKGAPASWLIGPLKLQDCVPLTAKVFQCVHDCRFLLVQMRAYVF